MTIDINDRVIPRIGSSIVASPFWKPCKHCGNPILFKKKVPYDIVISDDSNARTEPHKCKNTREQWREYLKEVDV